MGQHVGVGDLEWKYTFVNPQGMVANVGFKILSRGPKLMQRSENLTILSSRSVLV